VLQLVVGANILWRRRRLVFVALVAPVTYLAATDAYAIREGIWSISPRHTLGVALGGVLPLEEIVFFALTNILIVFGMTLFVDIGQRLVADGESHV